MSRSGGGAFVGGSRNSWGKRAGSNSSLEMCELAPCDAKRGKSEDNFAAAAFGLAVLKFRLRKAVKLLKNFRI